MKNYSNRHLIYKCNETVDQFVELLNTLNMTQDRNLENLLNLHKEKLIEAESSLRSIREFLFKRL